MNVHETPARVTRSTGAVNRTYDRHLLGLNRDALQGGREAATCPLRVRA